MLRYDAALFDMDGTLLNTLDDIVDALNRTLETFGYPARSGREIASYLGDGAYQLMQRALPAETDGAIAQQVLDAYLPLYEARQNIRTQPYPGVLPLLSALHEAGVKVAIISNKDDVNVKALADAHFGSLVQIAVGAQSGVPIKPAPDMLRLAMRELGVAPERTAYIGDSAVDYQAARNTGLDCVLVRWGYGDPRAMEKLAPEYVADDPAELPAILLREQEDAP
jgi:phosphoglycolate phosphatase